MKKLSPRLKRVISAAVCFALLSSLGASVYAWQPAQRAGAQTVAAAINEEDVQGGEPSSLPEESQPTETSLPEESVQEESVQEPQESTVESEPLQESLPQTSLLDESQPSEPEQEESQTTKQADIPVIPYRDAVDISTLFAQLGYPAGQQSIISGLALTYYDAETGEEVTNPSVGDDVVLNFGIDIPADVVALMQGGDYYDLMLPDIFTVSNDLTVDLVVPGTNISLGTVTIGVDGNIHIEFNDNINTYEGDLAGYVEFNGLFNKENIENGGNNTIVVPGEDQIIVDDVYIRPEPDEDISKSGFTDKEYNPNAVTWYVDINKSLDTLSNAVVTDDFPAGITYQGVTVYPVEVNIDGEITTDVSTAVPLVENDDYTVDENGTVTFIGDYNPLDGAFRLVYETAIEESAKIEGNNNVQFTNTAIITADDKNPLPAESTVVAGWGEKLSKAFTNYDGSTQTFHWQVNYNYFGDTLEAPIVITDILSLGDEPLDPGVMEYLADSFLLYYVDFDENGNPIAGDFLVEDEDYTLEIDQSVPSFTLTLLNDLNGQGVHITYDTKVLEFIDTVLEFVNEVDDGENSDTGEGAANQQTLVKTAVEQDIGMEVAYWRIDVNRNNYTMNNWSLSDDISLGQIPRDDLVITSTGVSAANTATQIPDIGTPYILQEDTDYEVVYTDNGDGTWNMSVRLLDDFARTNHTLRLEYSTSYNPQFEGQPIESFTNTATGTWTDDEGGTHSNNDNAGFDVNEYEYYNGSKDGSYNAQTKEITWDILVDYTGIGLQDAYIEDEIEEGQIYVPGSLQIYRYDVNSEGEPYRTEQVTDPEGEGFIITEPTENNEYLIIALPSGTQQYWIRYKTSVEGTIISETYENHAIFHNDLTPDYTLDAEVSVEHGGELIGKDGKRGNDGYVSWEILVNASQSTMQDVQVVDTPSANQVIDMDSLVVYTTNVDTDGNITQGTATLTEGEDYTAAYTQNEAGLYELTINFLNEIDEPYIIYYRVYIIIQPGDTGASLSNNVVISGNNVEPVGDGDTGELEVNVSGGAGIIEGDLGDLRLAKQSALTGAALPGATFQLYRYDRENDDYIAYGGALVANNDGEVIVINLPYGTYAIIETAAPAGYSIDARYSSLDDPYLITVNGDTGGDDPDYTLENPPSEVTLYKYEPAAEEGGDPTMLEGAVFSLQYFDPQAGEWETIQENLTTGDDGTLTVYELAEGEYRFIETQPPTGYKPTNDTYPFTMQRSAGVYVTIQVLVPNEPLEVILTKTDAEGDSLSGAVFRLDYFNGTTWQTFAQNLAVDENGELTVARLPQGQYRFVETTAPDGYTLNTTPLEFTLAPGENGLIPTLELSMPNTLTEVTLLKTAADTEDVLEGALFRLEQYINGIWTQIRGDEELVTGEDGLLTVEGLSTPGRYRFIEIGAPAGYSLSSQPLEFALAPDATGATPPLSVGPFLNEPSVATLPKVNAAGEALAGAEFMLEVYDEDADSWERIREDEELVSDEYGNLSFASLPEGRYRLTEIDAPDGYWLNPTPVEFELEADEDGVIEPWEGEPFVNDPAVLQFLKTNAGGMALAGAQFALDIYDEDTGSWLQLQSGFASNTSGILEFTRLRPGRYRVRETSAPNGYVLNETPVEFTVEANLIAEETTEPVASMQNTRVTTTNSTARLRLNRTGSAKTGDMGKTLLYSLLLTAAASGTVILALRKRKKL